MSTETLRLERSFFKSCIHFKTDWRQTMSNITFPYQHARANG